MIPLTNLTPGGSARLASVGGSRAFRRRLLEMGLLPGTLVRLVRRAELGSLVELEVRGCHLSLRQSEAREVVVEALAQPGPLPMPAAGASAARRGLA